MISTMIIVVVAVLTGATGLWLILPAGRHEPLSQGRYVSGWFLMMVALGLILSRTTPLGYWLANSIFYVLSVVTIISAAATVAMRKPVYAALWFGMTLLGTAGLFLFQGAQFLAVATIVVYAGAILVTYLFVLILAQPRGRAPYDRTSTEPLLAAAVGMILIGLLIMAIDGNIQVIASKEQRRADTAKRLTFNEKKAKTSDGGKLTKRLGFMPDPKLKKNILTDQHVARVGTELFARHLVAVEVAGVLLFVALVGATAVSRDAFRPNTSVDPEDQESSNIG